MKSLPLEFVLAENNLTINVLQSTIQKLFPSPLKPRILYTIYLSLIQRFLIFTHHALNVVLPLLHQATGAQLGLLASSIATIASGLAVSFSKSWRITLAMCAVTPLIYVGGTFFNVFLGGGGVDQVRSNAGSV